MSILDFGKLGQPWTPEQEAADRLEYVTRRDARIAERRTMIEALGEVSGMHEREAAFVLSMSRLAQTPDSIDRVMGGGLATLSERQVTWLTNLHQVYVTAPADVAAAAGPGPR